MKVLVAAFLVLLAFFSQTLNKVARINQYISAGQTAFIQKDYTTAIYFYKYLIDSLQVRDRTVRLNLAHAHFLNNHTSDAFKGYQPLLTKAPTKMASVVNVQLGILTATENKSLSLEYFKKAIVQDPTNYNARYNFELIKKYLLLHPEEANVPLPPPPPSQAKQNKENPKEETETPGNKENPEGEREETVSDRDNSDPDNAPEPNPDNSSNNTNTGGGMQEAPNLNSDNILPENQREVNSGNLPGSQRGITNTNGANGNPNKSKGGGEESDNQDKTSQTTYERLREANLSPEKARMLLEAMREAEVQYLQQIPRKSSKKADKNKPTW